MRGSGESDGVLLDEYSPLEQADAVEVIAWLAAQPWCTGAVGMFGISWGGFNSLQVAAHRPPALKAIVTLCSTDDRYADDVHYVGGCVLGAYMLSWGSTMLALNARPPDPAVVGERWRDMWLERLEGSPPFVETWLSHQRRDAYWKQGSVCEDYSAIECAVYAVGGWADAYTNAVLRLLAGATGPEEGPDRPLGPSVPTRGGAGAGDRIPPGMPPLVGPLAQGPGLGHHGRARPASLDAGAGRAGDVPRRAAGPLGRGAVLALCRDREPRRSVGLRRGRGHRSAVDRSRLRELLGRRCRRRFSSRPAFRGWGFAHVDLGAPLREARDPRVSGCRPHPRGGPAECARRRPALRRRPGRRLSARYARAPQPHPSRQPRAPRSARARPELRRDVCG